KRSLIMTEKEFDISDDEYLNENNCVVKDELFNNDIPKKSSNMTKIFFIQCFIFILIIVGAVFIKFYSSNLFFTIKDNIKSLMGESVVIENIFNQLDIFKEKAPQITQNVINPLEETAKTVIDKLEENISAQAEDKSNIENQSSGGRGTSITKKNGVIYPEKNVSLATYYLTKSGTKPVEGIISSNFGYRVNPVSGKEEFHPAVDIAAANGTTILSFLNGEIVEVSSNEIFGNFIKIKHGENLFTFYAHCDEIFVKQGFKIKEGERIGTVGKTGWATGPHLHFEIIINEKFVDPEIILNASQNKNS
ncbi:MAG: M23 family metallopeptidase, partial [Oscillospiraceae bacterium]